MAFLARGHDSETESIHAHYPKCADSHAQAKKPKSTTQAIEQFKPKTLLVLGDIFIFEENITIDIKYLKKSFYLNLKIQKIPERHRHAQQAQNWYPPDLWLWFGHQRLFGGVECHSFLPKPDARQRTPNQK
jgi:hypothetical protein|nr:hypothetical protein [uncultured Limnohabitans sp.]